LTIEDDFGVMELRLKSIEICEPSTSGTSIPESRLRSANASTDKPMSPRAKLIEILNAQHKKNEDFEYLFTFAKPYYNVFIVQGEEDALIQFLSYYYNPSVCQIRRDFYKCGLFYRSVPYTFQSRLFKRRSN